jgi:ferric-chelate reductase [NAD(P)H]
MTEAELAVLNQIQYGVFIVSSLLDDKINGQLATVVFQVTNEPIQIATCLNKSNFTHECVMESKAFGVSILSQAASLKFIGGFGFHTGRNFDKFANINYKRLVTGAPLVLENVIGILDLKVTKALDIDTHTLFIGELLAAEKISHELPLTYDYYHNVLKGSNHQHAPTFHKK